MSSDPDDHAWRIAYQIGRAAFPTISLAEAAFRARSREAGLFIRPPVNATAAADFFLSSACGLGEGKALATFEHLFLPTARKAIRRVRNDEDFVQETCQELWKKFFVGPRAAIRDFRARGALRTWVRVAAARLAMDLSAAAGQRPHPIGDVAAFDELTRGSRAPELALEERYREAFQKAVAEAFAGLTARQRTILRMKAIDGLSIDQIAAPYRVNRATVARWLQGARTSILELVRERLAAETGVAPSDFHSLLQVVRSQIHLSLARLLPSDATSATRGTR